MPYHVLISIIVQVMSGHSDLTSARILLVQPDWNPPLIFPLNNFLYTTVPHLASWL